MQPHLIGLSITSVMGWFADNIVHSVTFVTFHGAVITAAHHAIKHTKRGVATLIAKHRRSEAKDDGRLGWGV